MKIIEGLTLDPKQFHEDMRGLRHVPLHEVRKWQDWNVGAGIQRTAVQEIEFVVDKMKVSVYYFFVLMPDGDANLRWEIKQIHFPDVKTKMSPKGKIAKVSHRVDGAWGPSMRGNDVGYVKLGKGVESVPAESKEKREAEKRIKPAVGKALKRSKRVIDKMRNPPF